MAILKTCVNKLPQIGRKIIKEKNIDMDYLDYLLDQKKSKSKDNSMPPLKTKKQGQTFKMPPTVLPTLGNKGNNSNNINMGL